MNDDELVDAARVRPDASAPKCASSNTWTSAARRDWSPDAVVSRAEILARLRRAYGAIEPIASRARAPAERFRLPDGTTFGIIASTTAAVLRRLRPQPADGRRPAGYSASTRRGGIDLRASAARGRERRRARDADRDGLAAPRRSRRRGAPRPCDRARAHPGRDALKPRPAPRNAHARRLTPRQPTSIRLCRSSRFPSHSAPGSRSDGAASGRLPQSLRVMDTACFAHAASHTGRQTGCLCNSYRQVCIPCRTASTLCASLQARARRP